jgi:hypothetical protein
MALAMALWPNATWTDQLQDLWRDRLGGLNQDIVADAIKLVKPQFSSHQPELKWVLTKAAELAEQRMPRVFSGNQKPTFWYASWTQQSRHGNWPVRVGKWCQSEQEARACIPAGCAGNVSSSDPAFEPYTRDDQAFEEHRARQWVEAQPRDTLAAIIERVRKVGFLTHKLTADRTQWSRMDAMTVHAAFVLDNGGGQ